MNSLPTIIRLPIFPPPTCPMPFSVLPFAVKASTPFISLFFLPFEPEASTPNISLSFLPHTGRQYSPFLDPNLPGNFSHPRMVLHRILEGARKWMGPLLGLVFMRLRRKRRYFIF